MRISDWRSDVCSSDLQRRGVGERMQLVPCGLRLAAEDVSADVSDSLELLQQRALAIGIASRRFAQLAQVAAVVVAQQIRGVADIARGALVVAGIAGAVQHLDLKSTRLNSSH